MSDNINSEIGEDEQLEIHYKNKDLVTSESMREVAEEVMEDEGLDLEPAKLGYVEVYPNITKTSVGRVVNCNRELKLYSNLDYIIEISGEVWNMIGKKDRYFLMFQQLLQVLPQYKEKKDEWKFKRAKPDLKTFTRITNKYGTDWYERIKLEVSSIYDMDPDKERKITL